MLNQFEDMIIGKLVEQLNSHGINVQGATIKRALSDSPKLAVQIETILTTSSDTKEKIQKISALLSSYGDVSTTDTQPKS